MIIREELIFGKIYSPINFEMYYVAEVLRSDLTTIINIILQLLYVSYTLHESTETYAHPVFLFPPMLPPGVLFKFLSKD